jgi:hypothetical protein
MAIADIGQASQLIMRRLTHRRQIPGKHDQAHPSRQIPSFVSDQPLLVFADEKKCEIMAVLGRFIWNRSTHFMIRPFNIRRLFAFCLFMSAALVMSASNSVAQDSAVSASERDVDGIPLDFLQDNVLRNVRIDTPGPGALIAVYSAVFSHNNNGSRASCTANMKRNTNNVPLCTAEGDTGDNQFSTCSGVRTFKVNSAKRYKVFLVCREQAANVAVNNPSLTVIYVPDAQKIKSE